MAAGDPTTARPHEESKANKRAAAILRQTAYHILKGIPVAGPLFEYLWDTWEACREAERDPEGLNARQLAEALALIELRLAERRAEEDIVAQIEAEIAIEAVDVAAIEEETSPAEPFPHARPVLRLEYKPNPPERREEPPPPWEAVEEALLQALEEEFLARERARRQAQLALASRPAPPSRAKRPPAPRKPPQPLPQYGEKTISTFSFLFTASRA